MVADAAENNGAAMACTGAAKVCGICVLAESIQQNENNVTRFCVKGRIPMMVYAALAAVAATAAGIIIAACTKKKIM